MPTGLGVWPKDSAPKGQDASSSAADDGPDDQRPELSNMVLSLFGRRVQRARVNFAAFVGAAE